MPLLCRIGPRGRKLSPILEYDRYIPFQKCNLVQQIISDKLINVLTSHAIECPGLVFPGGGMKGLCLCLGLFWNQIYKYDW